MLSDYLEFLLQRVSASFLCGAGSMTVFAVVSGIDWLITRSWMEFKSKRRRERRYMKGIVVRSYNGVHCVEVAEDLIVPQIRNSDEVMIRVVAAGTDPVDLKVCYGYGRVVRSYIRRFCKGRYKDFPVILGRDCSGIVVETGSDVTTVSKGDHVWAVSPYCEEGLMSEYAVVKESRVSLKPRNLNFEDAASLAYPAVVTWEALVNGAKLRPYSTAGKRVLVYSSNSAYGLLTIQLLRAWGAHVTCTVPTTGLPMCRRLGSDDVIVYSVTDFHEELRNRTKFDAIVNFAGSALHRYSHDKLCAEGGQIVTLTPTPAITDRYGLCMGLLVYAGLRLSYWLKKIPFGIPSRIDLGNIHLTSEALKAVSELLNNCDVSPIFEVYSLQRAKEAFMETGTYSTVGRTVIKFDAGRRRNGCPSCVG